MKNRTVILEHIYAEVKPTKNKIYAARFYDSRLKQHITRKVLFDPNLGEFKMRNGHKNAKIDKWYKPVQVSLEIFKKLLNCEEINSAISNKARLWFFNNF